MTRQRPSTSSSVAMTLESGRPVTKYQAASVSESTCCSVFQTVNDRLPSKIHRINLMNNSSIKAIYTLLIMPTSYFTNAYNFPVSPDPLSSCRVPKVTPSKNRRSATEIFLICTWLIVSLFVFSVLYTHASAMYLMIDSYLICSSSATVRSETSGGTALRDQVELFGHRLGRRRPSCFPEVPHIANRSPGYLLGVSNRLHRRRRHGELCPSPTPTSADRRRPPRTSAASEARPGTETATSGTPRGVTATRRTSAGPTRLRRAQSPRPPPSADRRRVEAAAAQVAETPTTKVATA